MLQARAVIGCDHLPALLCKDARQDHSAVVAEMAHQFGREQVPWFDRAEAELAARPGDEPILDAMIAALAATTKVENLKDCGDLFRMAAGNPDLLGTHLLAWERAEARIISAVEDRLRGQASTLYVHALVGSLLSCAKAAMREWASSENPDHNAAQTLEDSIVATLTMLRDGFSRPSS